MVPMLRTTMKSARHYYAIDIMCRIQGRIVFVGAKPKQHFSEVLSRLDLMMYYKHHPLAPIELREVVLRTEIVNEIHTLRIRLSG